MSDDYRKVYMNGELVHESEAKISIYDSALMFGDMVFEMTRSFNKNQFELRSHIDRLYSGLKILRIHIDMSPSEMEEACYQTIEENDSLDLFLQVVDVDTGETLIFSASSNSSEIDFIINSADSMLTIIPAADWNGSADIMIIVSDGELQDSTSFLFTVGSVNDAPVIEQISNMVITSLLGLA